jgi:hypothetical protein
MRTSVFLFGILILAICVIIICESRNGTVPHTDNVQLIQPAGQPVDQFQAKEPLGVASTLEAPFVIWETPFQEIASQPESLQSEEELEELADSIPEEQLSATLDVLSRDQSSAGVIVARRLVQRWATESPEAAAQWTANLPANAFSQTMCRQAAVSWAQTNLAAAVAWAQQLPVSENKTAAISALALEAAAGGEALSAITLAADLPGGTERDDLLNYAVQHWAAGDTDTAVKWVEEIEDPALRQRMLGAVAVDLGAANPPAAAQLISNSMEAGPSRDDALVQVVRFWAVPAPEEAADWVEQLPEEALRDTIIENMSDLWPKDRAKAAGI